jgi:SAM-dependent methyltransferase
VVVTWALCSVLDATAALAEAHRVLRPGGSIRFVEHGRSPDASVAWRQDHLKPLWKRCSGCHLNRQTDDLLRSVGFKLARLKTGYAQGTRPMTFMYEGQQNRSTAYDEVRSDARRLFCARLFGQANRPPTVPIVHHRPRPYPGHFRDTEYRYGSQIPDFVGVPYRIRTGVAAVRER